MARSVKGVGRQDTHNPEGKDVRYIRHEIWYDIWYDTVCDVRYDMHMPLTLQTCRC